ncbi:unnamed protein product [Caenorhabditis sp. 36 PRJEB53466]|nr:unnamed protein product [Caenorhabditis sp. 36 PRJEB53466]
MLNASKIFMTAIRNVSQEVNALKKWKADKYLRDARRRGLLVKMTRQIIKINKILVMNACETARCRNGGTCIPRIGTKFLCLCPPHFTGETCEADVDECSIYNGTIAGCQNNGTCVNKRGGFECNCPSGYHGPLCQFHMSACSKTFELCGPHGHCIETVQDPTAEASSGSSYKCICDWGFKVSSDKNNPVCEDVDECDSNPCHPGVECINMPGSFMCSGCPVGYRSQGNSCVDIDECDEDLPCSAHSRCHNTIGAYYCDPCEAGYTGDGRTCTVVDICKENRCHPLATCKPHPGFFFGEYNCICPDGYAGQGMGPDGCVKSLSSVCNDHKCVNGGSCQPINETAYNCHCEPYFGGIHCETVSACREEPCLNGGACQGLNEKFYFCECTAGFFGDLCEQQEGECGEHFNSDNGTYSFDHTSNYSLVCDFVFNRPAPNNALQITFTAFDRFSNEGEGPTDCTTTDGNLTLFDGPSVNGLAMATFCGDENSVQAPLQNTPITMTSMGALLRFKGKQGKFGISWAKVERKCGYRTNKPEGILSVPQNKQDVACEWFITAPAGKIIEITIPAIQMHTKDAENCDQNSLEIFDGYSTYDRHRILETCSSTQEQQILRSTGPFLSVSFVSNMLPGVSGLETIRGFSMTYKFATPLRECGAELTNDKDDFDFNGVITSPNFGSLYPPNMDCTWKINGSLSNASYSGDMVIQLTFDEFDIFSGFSANGIGMHYRSFRRYNPLGVVSPGFSRLYGYRSIMDMGSCTEDFLKIHDGNGDMVHEGCNPRKPPNVLVVPNPAAVLHFHSDGKDQGKGFKLKYEMLCQKTVSGNGTLRTWNFPDGGSAGTCTYIIEAPRTHVINLRFLTIGLRVLPMSECFYAPKDVDTYPDYIGFSGGRSDNPFFNRRYVCPRFPFVEGNWMAVSAVRPLKITVASSGHVNNKGLSLEYTTTDVGCGGLFSSMTGVVSSPNYPEKYLPHMQCVYQIFVSWSKVVKLSFDTFDLEVTPATSCNYDRVEIYSTYHNETVHGELLGKFCGSLIPPAIFSKTNTMAIVFVSDRSVSGQGFSAKFEAVSRSTNCDFTFAAPSGQLVFKPELTRYEKCTFHIAVHENQRVQITVNNMTLPCDKSSLQFRNGPSETSPPFTYLPGDSEVCTPKVNFNPVLRSFSNRVTVIFKSIDSSDTFFNMTYETVASGCGGRIDGLSGVVSAPQYPLGDRRNMKCEWKVAVALGNKVRFGLTALDDLNAGDSSGFCPVFSTNRLDFYDSPRLGSRHLKRYCMKEMASEPITSDDNELVIKYSQMAGHQAKKLFGFSGHFTTLCSGIVLSDIVGNIQSPGYPHKVYSNQFCSWTIQVPKGNKILVTMHHFSVSQGFYSVYDCQGNMLKVDDTDLGEAEITYRTQFNVTNSVNKYCDRAVPRTIRSRHNTMKLTYISHMTPTNQFWLSWSTIGCSRDINEPGLIIIKKEHIDSEVDDFQCQYRIQAPIGKRINLRLERFDILPDSSCEYQNGGEGFNGMAVFMGKSNASGVAFHTVCEAASRKNISSQTDELFILISLDKNRFTSKDKIFFNATVEFIDIPPDSPSDTCGGIIDLERGIVNNIVSPGYPAPYPMGIQCRWLFRAPDGYHIEITVEEFHSPNYHEERNSASFPIPGRTYNSTCRFKLPYSDGMLTFFNGNSTNELIYEKVCQESTTPQVIEVYSSESLVVFEGASNIYGWKSGEAAREKNGVRLSVRPRCGGVVYAETIPQTISMFHEGDDVCNVTIKRKDPDDSEIFIRLEEYRMQNRSDEASDDDKIDIYVGGELKYTEVLGSRTTMKEYSAEEDIMISVQHASAPHSAVIVYSTDERNCGGEVRHQEGYVRSPVIRALDKPFDCAWTVSNNIGNHVQVTIQQHNLRATPNCTDSYIEIREFNSSGRLVERICEPLETGKLYSSQQLYVFLRFRPPTEDDDPDDEEPNPNIPLLFFFYKKWPGGAPASRYVSNPVIDKQEIVTWTLDVKDENATMLVSFSELYLPNPSSWLRFSDTNNPDEFETVGYEEVSGVMAPSEKYFAKRKIFMIGKLEAKDRFSLTWDPVPRNYKNLTAKKEKKKKVYDCGGSLVPSYDWESINSPLPAGQSFGYEESLHCRWTMTRPMFTGIELKFDFLDLEDTEDCAYDFVTFRPQLDDRPEVDEDSEIDFTNVAKHCKLARSNGTFKFSINRALHIHFITDKSRHGVGFRLLYRLTCNSFEHIRPSTTFEGYLQSPNYNSGLAPREWKCKHTLFVESNRKIFAEVLDLDIEENSPCTYSDSLILGDRFSDGNTILPESSRFCGTLGGESANFTSRRGYLCINYNARASSRKGFRLRIKEVVTECPSGVLQLSEQDPSRTIQSPEFPKRIPNSVECEYVMAAPNGHRVMLTFDSDNFDIDITPSGKCEYLDYIEVRDGPSKHSLLIGRYCGNRAPSTIFSTGSFLYMRLHSTEYGRSKRFVATYEIATCGGTIMVEENVTSHVTSPNFPDPFSTPIDCQWKIRSPNTHMLEARMEHIWLLYNPNCTMESLSILDGNSTANALMGPACVARQLPDDWIRSASNELTVKFTSNSTVTRGGRQYCNGKKCGFDLSLKLSETNCGGTITDAAGSLKPPGYPGKLLPHVHCSWDFKAKPGFVYKFRINFIDVEGYRDVNDMFFKRFGDNCFPDVQIVQGNMPIKQVAYTHVFCKNKEEYNAFTDFAQVVYDDYNTRELIGRYGDDEGNGTFYAPFTIDYLVIPANKQNKGCTFQVENNGTFTFKKDDPNAISVDAFCHIHISKPLNFGSVSVKIDNYDSNSVIERETSSCLAWDAHIKVEAAEPIIDRMICGSTVSGNSTEMLYVNSQVDLWISQAYRETSAQEFNLTIEIQKCGGVIRSPNAGEITSPNFGAGLKYLPNSKCRWHLEAPEGQIVKIKIVEMRIQYDHECSADRLIVGEGRQADVNVIHKYCHKMDGSQEQKLEDRFKTIRSHGRFLTLVWLTDANFESDGWKLEYEFVGENDDCGYHSRGMSGVIHSPDFGEKDYDNGLECIWDIQVPLGYHVDLKFRNFDVETSANCAKDRLVISQEHSTRANSPNGDYYFLFQDEEKENPLCGIEQPKDFSSESNRIRLNFTTDSKTTAKGFKVDWEAVCGTVYRLNHGVITSPHYPEGYPNKASTCTYLIAPKDQNAVIALKFSDFDLASTKSAIGRFPCEEDYLQIIEASTDRTVMNICGGSPVPEDPLIFKGPIGLKFVTDKKFTFYLNDTTLVNRRGFQLAYSINNCGDNLDLREGTKRIAKITSPAFPLPYARDLDCVWNITTDSDRKLNIRFEEMNLEDFRDCSADSVEFFDSSEMIANKTMGKFCGTMKKAPKYRMYTSGPNLLIHLKTDFNVNAGGFKLYVTSTLGEKDGCGGKVTATDTWQTLTSPKDDDGNYPPSLVCGWTISGPVNSQLVIRIDDVDTEKLRYPPGVTPQPECIDSLNIYDGQESFSPLLAGDICTKKTPYPKMLYSSHRHAFITFDTDQDESGKGFNISYMVRKNECGGWLQAESDTKAMVYKGITKEENKEADKERTHQRCRFMIQGSKTEPIIINFKKFNIPSKAGDCSDSYVEIRDVGSLNECQHPACAREPNQRKITKLCGTNVPTHHVSNTNTIQIIVSAEIVKSENNTRPSFKFEYSLLDNCNRTIDTSTIKSGRLTSPDFPQSYPKNSTCVTKLESSNQKMMITFSDFSLETSDETGCKYDYLQLAETDSNGTKHCGMRLPNTLLTSGKDLTATFQSDNTVSRGGYDASYFTVVSETDSRIQFADSYEMDGVLSNIGYPNGYNKSMSQVFTLRPPGSHDCSIVFSDLNIGVLNTKEQCTDPTDEYLEIEIQFKGQMRKARIRECTFKTNDPRELILEGDTNDRYLKFTFQSDTKSENDGRGFKIRWSCHSIGRTYPILKDIK